MEFRVGDRVLFKMHQRVERGTIGHVDTKGVWVIIVPDGAENSFRERHVSNIEHENPIVALSRTKEM